MGSVTKPVHYTHVKALMRWLCNRLDPDQRDCRAYCKSQTGRRCMMGVTRSVQRSRIAAERIAGPQRSPMEAETKPRWKLYAIH